MNNEETQQEAYYPTGNMRNRPDGSERPVNGQGNSKTNLNHRHLQLVDILKGRREGQPRMNPLGGPPKIATLDQTDAEGTSEAESAVSRHGMTVDSTGKIKRNPRNTILRRGSSQQRRGLRAREFAANKNELNLDEQYTQVLEQMIISLTGMELEELHEAVGGHLSEDYQTPARNAQMQGMYDRAEVKFFNNLSSDKLLRKLRRIDNKNNAEQLSSRLYGKNGKLIKQTKKKKRVRIGQPGGRQGGYQGGYQGGNQIGNDIGDDTRPYQGGYQGGNQIGNY